MPDSGKQEPGSDEQRAGVPEEGAPASARPARPARRRRSRSRRLIDTQGPAASDPVEKVRLTVGRIGSPHGIEGELRMILLTDAPEHLLNIHHVYLGASPDPVRLAGIRFHADVALISLDGVETPEAARKLGGLDVRIDGADAQPLKEGEYFLYQLIGLNAVSPQGEDLGVVVDLIETAAHDVLVISPGTSGAPGSGDLLIPNHPAYVHEIAPEKGTIVVTRPVYPDEAPS